MDWETLASQNPWWGDEKEIEKDEKVVTALGKKRKYIPAFQKGNQLIFGPRQTGKTTYLKLCIRELIKSGIGADKCLYFVCNLVMSPQDIVEAVSLFKKSGGQYVFLDEISFVPEWQRAVKHILEIKKFSEGMNFYFTGSTTLELQKERFPGRPIKIREFLPLTFREFCLLFGSEKMKSNVPGSAGLMEIPDVAPRLMRFFGEISSLFELYIRCGGFLRPAYELMEEGRIQEDSFHIYWSWIAGDIARIGLSERTLGAVLKGITRRYSSSFSLSSLAKDVEIPSHITVRDYLEILEKLYVLRSYWKGYEKVPLFRKERKVYFIDPFLYHLASFKTLGIKERPEDIPKVIEGIVGETIKRAGYEVKFIRKKQELDFFSDNVGIEVKWQEKVSPADFPEISASYKILLSKNHLESADGMEIIPVPIFLLLL